MAPFLLGGSKGLGFVCAPDLKFFFFKFLFYIGVQLINNVVLVSGIQQSDSVTPI